MKPFIFLLLLGVLSACGPVRFPLEAQVGGGLRSPVSGEVLEVNPAWSLKLGTQTHTAAAAGDRQLVVAGDDGRVYAVDAFGQMLWEVSLDTAPSGSPVILGTRAGVSAKSGKVTVLDLATGAALWTKEFGEEAGSLGSAGDSLVLPLKSRMVALRGADGSLLWESPHAGVGSLPSWTFSSARPVFSRGLVIHPDRAGVVRAWAAETGRVVWETALDSTGLIPYPGLWTPLMTESGLVVFHSRRQAEILNPDTGGVLGILKTPRDLGTEPGTDGRLLYFPARSAGKHLAAMTVFGKALWEITMARSSGSWMNTASVHGGVLAVGGSDSHTLYFISPESGVELGRFRTSSRLWGAPVWFSDRLCFVTEDGRLTALDLSWNKVTEPLEEAAP